MASSLFSANRDNSTNSKKAKRILCGRFSQISTKLPRIPLRRQKLPKVVGKPQKTFFSLISQQILVRSCMLFLFFVVFFPFDLKEDTFYSKTRLQCLTFQCVLQHWMCPALYIEWQQKISVIVRPFLECYLHLLCRWWIELKSVGWLASKYGFHLERMQWF